MKKRKQQTTQQKKEWNNERGGGEEEEHAMQVFSLFTVRGALGENKEEHDKRLWAELSKPRDALFYYVPISLPPTFC